MIKRIISLLLCLVIIGSMCVGCNESPLETEDKGAHINMYLSDIVYDLDPANAFLNDSTLKLVSLLFENLFYVDENGNLKKELAEKYEIVTDQMTNEKKMEITIGEGTWSDGIAVTANDVVYAWKRVLDNEKSFAAASLLFDIKNARAAKAGDASIDDVAVYALNERVLSIEFESQDVDYEQFLRKISSYALVPLREEVVLRNGADWAKKPATIVTSGPFKLRVARYEPTFKDEDGDGKDEMTALRELVLERNTYYHRDPLTDPHDKAVKPYRINIDYTSTDEELKQAYEDGTLFYFGEIPMSLRNDYKDEATVTDSLSTHTYVINQDAVVRKYNASEFSKLTSNKYIYNSELVEGVDGDKIFAKKEVRQALSLAIDREAIANAVVFAEAATALVPHGVFNTDSKKSQFRDIGGNIISSDADMEAAKALLASVGVNPSNYMFAISVAEYDEVHVAIAKMVQEAWTALGFNVALNTLKVIVNDDYYKPTDSTPTDIKDDIMVESYQAGNFEVAAIDLCALSVDAFSVLAPYAKAFSGEGMDMTTFDYALTPHVSRYDSEAYNELIEKVAVETNINKRAELLHEAEELLLDDMPAIPIIFNKNAVLIRKDLSKIEFTYFGTPRLKKTKLKNYELYVPVEEEE